MASQRRPRSGLGRLLLLCVSLSLLLNHPVAQDALVCSHEQDSAFSDVTVLSDGEQVTREILLNQTQLFYYENYNTTTMNQPDQYRKLMIYLEPCNGVVYLFVRKTRPCYPNPYNGEWTHFKSITDGSRDGAPTFFEVPLTSTKYYFAVYARTAAIYTFFVLADIGAFPRPGLKGRLEAKQTAEQSVQISWEISSFVPTGVSAVKSYSVYTALLLEGENRTNSQVFVRPQKVFNTVCGIERNTDKEYLQLLPSGCSEGTCSMTVESLIASRKYAVNVVVESERGFKAAYGGVVLKTEWDTSEKGITDATLALIAAVAGSVIGVVVIAYLWMLKVYA